MPRGCPKKLTASTVRIRMTFWRPTPPNPLDEAASGNAPSEVGTLGSARQHLERLIPFNWIHSLRLLPFGHPMRNRVSVTKDAARRSSKTIPSGSITMRENGAVDGSQQDQCGPIITRPDVAKSLLIAEAVQDIPSLVPAQHLIGAMLVGVGPHNERWVLAFSRDVLCEPTQPLLVHPVGVRGVRAEVF